MSDVDILGALVQRKLPFLVIFLGALVVLLLLKLFLRPYKNKKGPVKKNESSLTKQLIDKGDAYVSKDFLMSPTEQKVYKILERKYGEKYYIFAQVRVVDILQPNTKKYFTWTKEYRALFWQVSQWHFDYVMCHKDDFRIYCALELDDPSHEQPDRQRRDRILNAVCLDGGVVLKRMRLNHSKKIVEVVNE